MCRKLFLSPVVHPVNRDTCKSCYFVESEKMIMCFVLIISSHNSAYQYLVIPFWSQVETLGSEIRQQE